MLENYAVTRGSKKTKNPEKQIRCGNCYNILENGLGVSTILMGDESGDHVNRVHVSEATAYIYGISVEELQEITENASPTSHSSNTDNETPIVFCFQCASSLSENYKAHKKFEVGRQQLNKYIFGDNQSTSHFETGNGKSNFLLNSSIEHFGDNENQNENDHFGDFNFNDDGNVSDNDFNNEEKLIGIENIDLRPQGALDEQIDEPSLDKIVPMLKELFIKLDRLSDDDVQRLCGYKAKSTLNDSNRHKRFLRWSQRQLDETPISENKNPKLKRKQQTENNIDKSVMCSICQEVLETPWAFRLHLIKVHRDIKPQSVKLKVACKYCGKMIAPSKIRLHLRTHSGSGVNNLTAKCDICKRTMENVKALYEHIKLDHSEKIECEICKKLIYLGRMDVHKQIYHRHVEFNTVVKKVKCDVLKKHEKVARFSNIGHRKNKHDDSTVTCTICGKLSKNLPSLERHILVKHSDSVSCRICRKELTLFTLKDHIIRKHENGTYKCEHCPKIFTSKLGRDSHLVTHMNPEAHKERLKMRRMEKHRMLKANGKLPPDKIECEICKKLISSEGMDAHKLYHTNAESNVKVNSHTKVSCKICGKLTRIWYLPCHMRSHEDAPVNCDLCGKLMNNPSMLNRHMNYAHGPTVSCRICKKEMTVEVLRVHIKRKHAVQPKIYKCEYCPKVFWSSFGYNHHVGSHINPKAHEEKLKIRNLKRKGIIPGCKDQSGGDGGKYICVHCGKVLATKAVLDEHEKKHTEEKQFICHLCPKKFFSKVTLQIHLQTHSTEKQFKCDECGKMFQHKHYLSQHKKNHKEVAKNGEKSVKCEECGKFFMHSLSLSKHKRRYHRSDVKTNICKYCGQRFPFPKAKNRHEKKCGDKPTG